MEGNATLLPRLAAAISVVGILSGFSAQVPATAPAPTPTTYTLVTEPSAGLSSIYTLISSAKKTIGDPVDKGEKGCARIGWAPDKVIAGGRGDCRVLKVSAEGGLDGGDESLLIAQEEMSDTGVETALESALTRGVAETMVQENESNKYNAILATLKKDGAKIAVYTSPTGYYIHAKAILADYGTAQANMFIGSENISTPSLNSNRELGLVFNDQASMATVETAVTADYNGGTKF